MVLFVMTKYKNKKKKIKKILYDLYTWRLVIRKSKKKETKKNSNNNNNNNNGKSVQIFVTMMITTTIN